MIIKNRKGQGLTEYVILVALIAVASLGVIELLGSTINQKIAVVTEKLQGFDGKNIQDSERVKEKHYRKRTLRNFWKNNE